jgi:hypothetical protein
MKRSLIWIPVAILALSIACCCCGIPTNFNWNPEFNWDFDPIAPPEPEPEPTPNLVVDPVPSAAEETARLLEETVIPVRDLHELAIRLNGLPADTPRTINPEGSPDYALGTRRVFHVSNVDTDESFDITAILEYKTPHVYMWVEDGVPFDQNDLVAAADLFEQQTYQTNRTFFGSEWSPGVDNDPHVSILHASGLGTSVAGYYSSADEFVSAVRDDSNEMEMFYINADNVTINSSFYNGVLSHEFQHMIHWYNDRNEDTWLNEGFSELAMYLNNFDVGGSDYTFARVPDTQLNSWPEGPGAAGANYGAGYLFTSYFLDRFGPEATQGLVGHVENSVTAVDEVLAELDGGLTHEDLFGDWIVANLLDEPDLLDGRYGYTEIDPPEFDIDVTHTGPDLPVSRETTVRQYATDYIEIEANQPLRLTFSGSTQIGLFAGRPHSGDYLWWSNRGDDSDMTLTREFDLSGVDSATLQFWCWYDIEEDWDYAYVEASTDGGQTWEILTTPSGTSTDPNGNSFGWAYTGSSGGGPEWIQEEVDLTPYAGQTIQIRFEYITDDAVNRPGFALDDVAIPEIGYTSDFEADAGGWEPAGFIRHANVLPQEWLVQLVTFGNETAVERLALEADQTGSWEIPLGGGADRAVVTVSALAPVTTEPASYRYEIAP